MTLDVDRHITPFEALKPAKCRSCGRDIVWARTSAGATMPLDARPAQAHVYAIGLDEEGKPIALRTQAVIDLVVNSWPLEESARHDVKTPDKVFVSHFLTCPNPPRASR